MMTNQRDHHHLERNENHLHQRRSQQAVLIIIVITILVQMNGTIAIVTADWMTWRLNPLKPVKQFLLHLIPMALLTPFSLE
jgi:hypothetical protein